MASVNRDKAYRGQKVESLNILLIGVLLLSLVPELIYFYR